MHITFGFIGFLFVMAILMLALAPTWAADKNAENAADLRDLAASLNTTQGDLAAKAYDRVIALRADPDLDMLGPGGPALYNAREDADRTLRLALIDVGRNPSTIPALDERPRLP